MKQATETAFSGLGHDSHDSFHPSFNEDHRTDSCGTPYDANILITILLTAWLFTADTDLLLRSMTLYM